MHAWKCSEASYRFPFLATFSRRSFILSSDMAHAVHPNYASKHDKHHSPQMNKGVVIKTNTNQRYATNGHTAFLVKEIARGAGVPVQQYSVRNDCRCGSTIGPMYASTPDSSVSFERLSSSLLLVLALI